MTINSCFDFIKYGYPKYTVELTREKMLFCRDIAQKLLEEIGLKVCHEKFRNAISKHDGVRIDDDRVYLSRQLTDIYFEEYIVRKRAELISMPASEDKSWSLSCGGFSIAVLDIETDEARPATTQDLRDLIRLCNSLDISGNYPCTPQDLPPLMRTLSCFKICWEESDKIRPFDYLDSRQVPFLYEMHRVMGKPMSINVNICEPFTISEHDIDIVLDWYPKWKEDKSTISWYSVCDYPMLGITKPITSSGSITSYLSQSFGTYILFKLFDQELEILPRLSAGMPVDLQTMCWAWGSPRQHLYDFMNYNLLPLLCGLDVDRYNPGGFITTSSCAVDSRAGMEKMATMLIAAMQGAREFGGAGNLAVDDLFSGIQLALDKEIFEYVKESIEAFSPHEDIMSIDGIYEVMRDVALGGDEFYSHMDTATKVRNILSVSKRRPSEKLRSWMMHKKNLNDRLREECLERIRTQKPFVLAKEKKRELDKIYKTAEKLLFE